MQTYGWYLLFCPTTENERIECGYSRWPSPSKPTKPFIISVASVFNQLLKLAVWHAVTSSDENLKRLNGYLVHQLVDTARLVSVGLQSLCEAI